MGASDKERGAGVAVAGAEASSETANGVSLIPVGVLAAGSKLKEGESGSDVVTKDCAPAVRAADKMSMKRMAVCRIDRFPPKCLCSLERAPII